MAMTNGNVHSDFLDLYLSMLRVQKALCRRLEQSAPPSRMPLAPSHISALMIISQDHDVNMSGLAGEMLISRQQATGIVDLLVERGLAVRRENRENRREVLLELTDMGSQVMVQIREWLLEAIPSGKSERELARAISTVRDLVQAPAAANTRSGTAT